MSRVQLLGWMFPVLFIAFLVKAEQESAEENIDIGKLQDIDLLDKYPGLFQTREEIREGNTEMSKEPVHEACCDIISKLEAFHQAQDVDGNPVRIVQINENAQQVFETDVICRPVPGCKCNCGCAMVNRIYVALVRKEGSNRVGFSQVNIPTTCRCLNNLVEVEDCEKQEL